MKQEVDHWKTTAERLQKENTQLQKESLKLTQELMERVKMIKSKDDTISKLKSLAPVEEAICQKCSQSLEESFVMQSARKEQQDINELVQARAQQLVKGEISMIT